MLDRDELKNSITLDEMKTLLIELGVQHIEDLSHKGHLITNTICHNISDGSLKLYYYIEEKVFHCYTGCGQNFNIFDLVIKNHKLKGINLNFPQSMQWVARKLGRKVFSNNKPEGFQTPIKENKELAWMNKFTKKKIEQPALKTYSDSILLMFSKYHHPLFLEDNISHNAMNKFEIMYYSHRHKIIIPHRKWDTGEIIGIKTRSLDEYDIEQGFKYIPLKLGDIQYSYSTHQNLYGLFQNKRTIQKLRKCVIFESEKSVLQCESYYEGNNFSVALSGSNISQYQVDILLKLGVEEVILALDKEYINTMSDESIKYQAKLLRLGRMFSKYCRVNVIFDTQDLLELKDSPSDKGKEILEALMRQKQPILLIE